MSVDLLLEASGIAKSFSGVPALKDGRLRVYAGTVHALCGGNGAGKSTFLNVLMGLLPSDAGEIWLRGRHVRFHGPLQALEAGISMISQELEPIPGMTVAENIFLGREPQRFGFLVDYRELERWTRELLADLHLDISPLARMSQLSLAEIQLVEIAKAISYRSELLIMDEPTSAIGEREAELLFGAIERLKERGTGIIYVSHRMNELYRIADEYTVFRDGDYVESGRMADVEHHHLVNQIVGSEIEEEFSKFNHAGEDPLLRVSGYTRQGEYEGVTLDVRDGEILGLFGLMGAGRSEFLTTLFGLNQPDEGEIWIHGMPYAPRSPRDAMAAGLALVTEDRKTSGLVLTQSIRGNISLASLDQFSQAGLIGRRAEARASDRLIERLGIVASSREMLVQHMSGGNQQKVVLAKWMHTEPKIFLLDEPTRGIDVGAKREMYHFMSDFARDGKAVVMVSSEMPEILGMCDRVAVFRRGQVSGVLAGDELNQGNLASLAS